MLVDAERHRKEPNSGPAHHMIVLLGHGVVDTVELVRAALAEGTAIRKSTGK
jgi:hypothetical protein